MSETSIPSAKLHQQQHMAGVRGLKAAKKALRILMKEKLAVIPKALLDRQSRRVFEALLDLRQYKEAKRISVYLSMPSGEIQTDDIVRHALSSGKDVFIPYLHKNDESTAEDGEPAPKKVMDMVKLKGLEDYERLERDSWGIPTVTEETVKGRERILGENQNEGKIDLLKSLDLILMPGVAFNLEGQPAVLTRLGHGKGFYDYFLHRYRRWYDKRLLENTPKRPPLQHFGLALEEQFLQDKNLSIPMGPHDSNLSGLIIGNGKVLDLETTIRSTSPNQN